MACFGTPPRALGPDGALWFTEQFAYKIGRITTSGALTEFPIPTPDSQPTGIAAGLDGSLYFTEWAGNKIGRITTQGEITEFPIPTPGAFPWEIALDPDDAIWFTEEFGNKIGRLSIPMTFEPADRLVPIPASPRGTPRVLDPRD